MIEQFTGEYSFLSNFFPSPILYEGDLYPTAEHLYQALKADAKYARDKIRLAPTPGNAKYLGKRVRLKKGWDTAKEAVMREVVKEKFRQNHDLMKKLLATGKRELREGNWWRDGWWGVDLKTGKGENKLGKILMEIRSGYS